MRLDIERDGASERRHRAFPSRRQPGTGLQEFGGTSFDVRGIVGCGGLCPGWRFFPALSRNIRVGIKCHLIHCLQATLFESRSDVQVGTYVLRYADGQTEELPLVYGK